MEILTESQTKTELLEARRLMGLKNTNFTALSKALAYLVLKCPDNMASIVNATFMECERRKFYVEFGF